MICPMDSCTRKASVVSSARDMLLACRHTSCSIQSEEMSLQLKGILNRNCFVQRSIISEILLMLRKSSKELNSSRCKVHQVHRGSLITENEREKWQAIRLVRVLLELTSRHCAKVALLK